MILGGLWRRSRVVLGAVGLLAAGAQPGGASTINWDRNGPFETCLEDRMTAWVFAKAQLVANQDAAASDIDDVDVALWAVTALQECETQAGSGNPASVQKFSKHMAHWREHIHKVAQTVRRRSGAD